MINDRDIAVMKNDIIGIIDDWHDKIIIKNIKPTDDQPAWNKYMGEVVGTPLYLEYHNIPADITINKGEPFVTPNVGGPKYNGKVQLHIPILSHTHSKDDTVPTISIYLPSEVCTNNSIHVHTGDTEEIDGEDVEIINDVTSSTAITITDDTIFILNDNPDEVWTMTGVSFKVGEILITIILKSGE